MLERDVVQAIIIQALSNINDERGPAERFEVGLDTQLFGPNAHLDSLSLVSVIVDVETAVSDVSGRDLCLTDDRAMSQTVSPFSDVQTLTAYILLLLSET
jgi:hypothetical protein